MSILRTLCLFAVPMLLLGCPPGVADLSQEIEEKKQREAEEAEAKAKADAERPKGNILTRPAELVDRNKWMAEHEGWEEFEYNEGKYTDPVGGSLYVGRQKIGEINNIGVERFALQMKLLNNDKWMPFEQFKKEMDRSGLQMRGGLKKGQVYGYNDQNGQITILSPPEEDEAS